MPRDCYAPQLFSLAAAGSLTTCSRADGHTWFNYTFLTAKERDNETGLDYFIARYHASMMGRFTSPDELFADQSEADPQSWNLYTYAGNSPLVYTDRFGRWKQVDCTTGGKAGKCWESDRSDDSYASLAKLIGGDAKMLANFFQNGGITMGQVFDTSGYRRWAAEQWVGDHLNPDRYEFGPPMGGGLRVVGSAARAGGSLVGRFFNWAFKRGGSGTVANAARPATGQIFQRTIQTSKGPVDVIAEIVVEGDKLVLKDIAIYGRGTEPLTGLAREILSARSQLAAEARALGFKELQITGKRVATSTSANPGHEVNVTMRLQ